MTTLLTSGAAPDPEKVEAERETIDLAIELCGDHLSSYRDGGMTLDAFLRAARRVLSVNGVSAFDRRKALGELVELALDFTPKKARAGVRQRRFEKLAFDLVEIVHAREGFKYDRRPDDGSRSALDRAAEIFRLRGITASSSTVEKLRGAYMKHTGIKKKGGRKS